MRESTASAVFHFQGSFPFAAWRASEIVMSITVLLGSNPNPDRAQRSRIVEGWQEAESDTSALACLIFKTLRCFGFEILYFCIELCPPCTVCLFFSGS